MKRAALILLCAIAQATANNDGVYPNDCPKDWSIEQLLPHRNCHQFYQCWDGKLVEHICPSKLYFSIEQNRCEWAEEVNCADREVPDDNNDQGGNNDGNLGGGNCDPSQAPEICAAEGSDNVLVAHENCNQFYICADGQPVAQSCPANLLFNPQNDRCDWPDHVECGDRLIPDGGNGDNGGSDNGGVGGCDGSCGAGNNDPSQAPAICASEGSEGVLVAHEKCNKFYICNGGQPVTLKCPDNLLFNPIKDQCDWPENVNCEDRDEPTGGEGGGNGDGGNGGAGNCDPSQAPTICAAEGSDSVLVAHENCNKYYICAGGSPVAKSCPANLLFNPQKDQCDWPENVDCGDRLVPDGENGGSDNGGGGGDNGGGDNGGGDGGNVGAGNCDPSQAPTICAAEGSDSVLVAHENCNKYYICVGGSPLAKSCPANLLFNPQNDRCDWPENVDCGDRLVPDGENGGSDNGGGGGANGGGDGGNVGAGNCDPNQAPTICAAEGSDSVLVAHEKCNKYYICAGGSPLAQSCPANLLFNPQKDQCDWPENVDCGDRLVPDGENGGNDNGGSDNGGSDNGGGGGDNGGGDGGNVGAGNCDPSQAPTICAAEGSDSVLVAHENCNKYYICAGGSPLTQSCPANLLFNPQKDQCDWPENVDCGDRLVPDGENGGGGGDNGGGGNGGGDGSNVGAGNCDPSQAPTICAAEGSDSVLVAHENCNKYYICAGGNPVAQSCPANLLFNPQNDQCDWPENVDCGDRLVPDGENGGSDNGGGGGDNGGDDNGGGDNGGGDGGNVGAGNCDPSQAPTICAAEGSDSVLVAHEKCNKYYICAGGSPLAQSCPANLLFNPQNDQCDWPENVDCGDRLVPDGENGGSDNGSGGGDNGGGDNGGGDGGNGGAGNCDPSQAPTICAAEGSDSVLIAHENCNKYYICAGGSPLAQSCPANLLFNPQKDQCDWPENVDCGDRLVPDGEDGGSDNGGGGGDNGGGGNGDNDNGSGTCNCKPEEAPAICAADNSEGVLVAHEQCNKFYICSGGSPVALRCPENLLFNPYTNQCDWPQNVECGDRVVPDGDTDDNGSGGNDNGGSDNGGGGNGDNDNGSGTCNCKPEEAPAICAAGDSEGVLVAHEQCNKFYVCNGGSPVALRCPGNLLFNPYTNQCDWPQNVECGNRVVPDGDTDDNGNGGSDNGGGGGDNGGGDNENGSGGSDNGGGGNGDNDSGSGTCNCKPEEAPAICSADNSEGVLVAHEQCNKFYICSGGSPVALRCPGNLLFNPYTNQCDWPQNVECGDRIVPDGDTDDSGSGGNDNGGGGNGDNDNGSGTCNCKPEEAPAICAADDSEGVLVAHEQCNKFYVCNGGSPVTLRCPGNLLFNPYTNQCDWPQNVECGDRVVPDGDTDDNGNGGSDNGGGGNGDNGSGTCNCKPEEAPAICAAGDSEGVLVAHEQCNKFYVCNGGSPVALRCPGNLLFNPYTNQCDWAENVECGDRVVPDGDTDDNGNGENDNGGGDDGGNDNGSGTCNCNPEEAPAICAADGSEGVFVAHEKCNKFYVCNGGLPVTLRCPGDLLYNPYTNQCDWAENVQCGNDDNNNDDTNDNSSDNDGVSGENEQLCLEGNGGAGNDDPSQAAAICASENSEGVLVANENCSQFYICDHNRPVVLDCPVTLLFNPYNDKCDWSHCVECGNRINTDTYFSMNKHLPARQAIRF